jgi:chromosome segregation ATPase
MNGPPCNGCGKWRQNGPCGGQNSSEVEQQQRGVRQAAEQLLALDRQLEDQGRERAARQERVDRGGRELEELDTQLLEAERVVQGLEHQRRLLIHQRELAQLLLNLIQLQEESRRLQEHRDRFQSLQGKLKP